MRVIYVLFDSLNRSALGCYGGAIATPNFDRLAARSMRFDRHYIGSMPCMPARRDMHTGRLNFLHRSWGPLEIFDDSFAVSMGQAGVYSHLVTDHNHYFEDGGSTYHNRYSSFDFIRGQESDPWVAMVKPPLERFREQYHPEQFGGERIRHRVQGMLNETALRSREDYPVVKCVDSALSFLATNGAEDHWFLHLECFDPHEPFSAPASYREHFPTRYQGPIYTWPQYRTTEQATTEEIEEIRANYGALVSFCDDELGRLLDVLDAQEMWQDTAVVLTTDHGFMLGEHGWWGKNRMPFFNEIANIPLLIHDPRHPDSWGTHCTSLTQTTDLSATLLDLFELPAPAHGCGQSLLPLIDGSADQVRELALYGIFGGALNATDGHYSYFLYPRDMERWPLYEYTLMPMHTASLFTPSEVADAELYRGFDFTKGAPVLRMTAKDDAKRPPLQGGGFAQTYTCLYDLAGDPGQTTPFRDPTIESHLRQLMIAEMHRHEAPQELYQRFGLAPSGQ
ncbi:sulfatase-like hydrolase/transferase [Halomonas sp. DP5Y7-2]|uniref:sulfatase-like hydrolase/transferase n=1 Tax=Halomonas sp. DP5Y7-2 TaxID=2859076 RepID=UPI001C9A24F7|nr:sulfatase-like hydrolase/transferase [Halomonas sp. DP5Y7-2]MBY5985599.1 sulfatase-like hydrolase/transferase [Halomonas sp. DP5Y7-2]